MARRHGRAGSAPSAQHAGRRTRARLVGGAVAATTVAAAAVTAIATTAATGHQVPAPFTGWSTQQFSSVFDSRGGTATAEAHSYSTPDVGSLAVDADHGVLSGDKGGPLQLTAHTQPSHGSLTLNPDGSFIYHPAAGFTGTDSFTYAVSNAVHLYTDHLPSLGTYGGVDINAGGYGSSVYPDPGRPGYFYGLEDRGPNVTAPDGNMALPIPSYDPSIGLFHMVGNDAVLVRKIPLEGPEGQPFSGLIPPTRATTDEGQAADLSGTILANDPDGYDSEGLVAMPDGSFWVSDEYGPFVTHFDRYGHELQQLSPLNGTLPAELQYRVANKGMEGLTITPDGKELVGIMQSALQQPDIDNGAKATKLVPMRIVTYNLKTRALHEYLYLLHNPAMNGTAVSEIAALDDDHFLVDERDGCFPGDPGLNPAAPGVTEPCTTTQSGAAFKQLYEIDLAGATDIGPSANLHTLDTATPGDTFTYSGGTPAGHLPTDAHGNPTSTTGAGLLINGKSIEHLVEADDSKTDANATTEVQQLLEQNGITPASSSLYVDLNALIGSVTPGSSGPTYAFFSHDKMEGVAVLDGGKELVVSNDSDFGITQAEYANGTNASDGYTLDEKVSPVTGQQDNGEYLAIDMNRVNPSTGAHSSSVSQQTVTIKVTAAPSGS